MMNQQVHGGWFLASPPGILSFAILLITGIAEVNRTPFDLPEAESEIIAGYHTEYSGMRFGLFFLAEYLSVFSASCLATVLFLGAKGEDLAERLVGVAVPDFYGEYLDARLQQARARLR